MDRKGEEGKGKERKGKERIENEQFVESCTYLSCVEGPNRRGTPLGRWEDRVKEQVSKRGVRGNMLDRARREWMDRERWRSVHGRPLGGHFQRE